MKTAVVLLLSLLSLLSSCGAQDFCKNKYCPSFKVIHTEQAYETRTYEASTWMRTKIDSTANGDILAANSRLKSFIKNYPDLDETWPVLITHTKEDQLWMSWFVHPNVSLSGTPSVEIFYLPESTFYVRTFSGTPSVSAGKSNAESLLSSLNRVCQSLDSVEYYGAGYDSYFSLKHHNEVWINQNSSC